MPRLLDALGTFRGRSLAAHCGSRLSRSDAQALVLAGGEAVRILHNGQPPVKLLDDCGGLGLRDLHGLNQAQLLVVDDLLLRFLLPDDL